MRKLPLYCACMSCLMLFVFAVVSEASANDGFRHHQDGRHRACGKGDVKILSISPITGQTYDPLDGGDKEIPFSVKVKNNSASECRLSFAVCLAAQNARMEPKRKLPYDVVGDDGGTSILNKSTPRCPEHSGLLRTVDGAIGPGETQTFTGFRVVLPAGHFVNAGEHRERGGLEFGVYSPQRRGQSELLDSYPFDISVAVAQACEIPTAAAPGSNVSKARFSWGGGVANSTVDFSQAINDRDATVDSGRVDLTFLNARCNYRAYVSVKSQNGGMKKISGSGPVKSSGAFLDRIDYTANATFCGKTVQFITRGNAISDHAQCESEGINRSHLKICISTEDGSTPVLAGQYQDVLTVQIGAPL